MAVQAAERYIDLRAMSATRPPAAPLRGPDPPGAQTAQRLHGSSDADDDSLPHRHHAGIKHLELALGPAAAYEERLGDLLAAHALG